MIIDVKLSGQTLSLPQSPIVLAEGAVNAVRFRLIPDDEWADMSITATFRSVGELGDEIARDVLVYNKSVSFPIPPEVLRSGYLYIGCTGTAEAGEIVLTTKVLDRPLTVWTAERIAEEWAKVVTPDVAAQILAILGDMSKLDTASKNNLVAAINECYGKDPTKIIPVSAHSGNGFSYVASGEQLPTVVPGSAGAHVGKGTQIVFIPDMTNTEPECTLQINGGSAVPIRRRAKTGTQSASGIVATLPMEAGVLIRGVPYTLTFCGLYWLLDSYVPLDGGGGGVDEEQLAQAVKAALTDAVKNGEVASAAHEHSYSELKDKPVIPTIPDSLPANGGNADTVGGKTAAEIQTAAESGVPAAVQSALQEAKESGLFDGRNGEPGKTPAKGVDYWTAADKAEMVQAVLDALGGVPVFGVVDADNVIVFSGALAEGVYTLMYEDADGKVTEIGTLNHTNAPEVTYTNLFDASKATLNTRMSGSSNASKAQDGYVMTAEIQLPSLVAVSQNADDTTPFALVPNAMWANSANIFGRATNGDFEFFVDAGATPGETIGTWRKIPFRNQWNVSETITSIIVSLYVKGSAISASDVQGIEIYYNEIPE